MWLVQAMEAPTQTIIQTSHGEVVITKHRADTQDSAARPTTVGAAKTIALCGADGGVPTGEGDPWSKHDPWMQYKPTAMHTSNGPTEGLQQMEARIQTAVLEKMNCPMEQDDLPDRVHALENQVQTLLSQQQTLESQFQESSAHQSQQLTAIQGQVNAQAQQLHGHLENQNQTIQSLFEQQMTQIRGLLAKRPRDDSTGNE